MVIQLAPRVLLQLTLTLTLGCVHAPAASLIYFPLESAAPMAMPQPAEVQPDLWGAEAGYSAMLRPAEEWVLLHRQYASGSR